MKAGDLVRFREILEHGAGLHRPTVYSKWRIGLLKEYHTWEKIATISIIIIDKRMIDKCIKKLCINFKSF